MAIKEKEKGRQHKKRTRQFYKKIREKHFGSRESCSQKYNYFWALNVPKSYHGEPSLNFFENKCLLICATLGLLQQEFLKNNNNKTYIQIQKTINSSNKYKQKKAGNILRQELHKLILATNLPENGPYELEETCKKLNEFYKCQFFVFNGLSNNNKLLYMFPHIYDDSLLPIYIYNPNTAKKHFVYIKNLPSFFKNNFRICFCCKKNFRNRSSVQPMHNCRNRPTCFACRRFFQTKDTFLTPLLIQNFCDKNVTVESSFLCNICNVTVYSEHCFKSHKRFCGLKNGNFGYKCLDCGTFTYRMGSENSKTLKEKHQCKNLKKCTICFKVQEENHLCRLKKETFPTHNWPRLAFISFEHYSENDTLIPFLATIHREEVKRGNFSKHVICASGLNFECNINKRDHFYFKYFINEQDFILQQTKKLTDDFKINLEILKKKDNYETLSLTDKIILFSLDLMFSNTTYVIQDFNSTFLMTLLNSFISNGFAPNVVRNKGKLLLIEIKALNVRFITSNSYLNGDEYDIATQFNISFNRHYFISPILANYVVSSPYTPCNKNPECNEITLCKKSWLCGKKECQSVPNKNLFYSPFDSVLERDKKTAFYTQIKTQKWTFVKELIISNDQKLMLLTLSILKFIKESFDLNVLLNTSLNLSNFNLLHPLSNPLLSMSGYSYKLFKLLYLNNEDIYCVKN
jgi:hypothetical protein